MAPLVFQGAGYHRNSVLRRLHTDHGKSAELRSRDRNDPGTVRIGSTSSNVKAGQAVHCGMAANKRICCACRTCLVVCANAFSLLATAFRV